MLAFLLAFMGIYKALMNAFAINCWPSLFG